MFKNVIYAILFVNLYSCLFVQGTSEPVYVHDKAKTDLMHPTDWLSLEADARWEWLNAWNIDTLKNNSASRQSKWNFTINRFRLGTKTAITEDVDFNHRWVWEFRTWDGPDRYQKEVDFSEITWDKFNFTLRNSADMPLTIVAGRQDIMFGKGWLVMDGTNIDEGRTIFFDALRFTYEMPRRDTTFDLIYINQSADSSAWLKPFADSHDYMNRHDQKGSILYVTDRTMQKLQLEGYFIYKGENAVESTYADSDVYTLGGAACGMPGGRWQYRAEGALQAGNKNMQSLRAFGTTDTLEYHFKNEHKNVLHVTAEYLSGDDPGTDDNESFDLLWGRWPQWSVINSYVYLNESSPSETTNLFRINLGHSFYPAEKMQICTDYHMLWANENTKGGTSATNGMSWSEDKKFRGHLFTGLLNYKFTKRLKTYFLFEYFAAGNYYAKASRDPAYVSKLNVEYTFN